MVNNILSIKDYFSPTFLYNLFQKDPVYVCFLGVAILTAVISLIVGWVKGVKKLRLTGIAWCLAGVAYFLVRKFLASKLPVES